MQHVLELNGVKSKPFDFEAMCLIDDCRAENTGNGKAAGSLRMSLPAVSYLFAGTDVDEKTIQALDTAEMARLCTTVYKWYVEVLTGALKNA